MEVGRALTHPKQPGGVMREWQEMREWKGREEGGDSIRRLAGCPTAPYHKRLGHQTGRARRGYGEGGPPLSVQTSLRGS